MATAPPGATPPADTRRLTATIYGSQVSKDLVSRVTDAVLVEMREWQNRPLDRVWPVIFIDAIIAYHSNDLSRIFVVGGTDRYVIEIDFNPLGTDASDDQLDAILTQLRRVELATFETALPEGSITSATADAVIAEMLTDVPLPEGFDSTKLTSKGDRYQTGAHVAGVVACTWLDQWANAIESGDASRAVTAADALATSRNWPILIEMQNQGGYSQVVWEYADTVTARTITAGNEVTIQESYPDSLGCGSK